MGSHPLNLALRFMLELAALFAFARWGWIHSTGLLRYFLGLGLPLLAAVLWGTFAVPDDPSRSGKAPVPIPGLMRLLLELVFFGFATWCFFATGLSVWGWILGVVTLLHYLASYDRMRWLLKR